MTHDRHDAGDELAKELTARGRSGAAVVVGIPRGGAIVAASAATKLGLAYECVPVCRIGMPCFPELTLGALDPDGVATFDPHTELTSHEVGKAGGSLAKRLQGQVEQCRGGRDPMDFAGKDVIAIDEALDNEIVPRAIAGYLRRQGAASITYATPVAATDLPESIRSLYDEVVTVHVVSSKRVHGWYGDSTPTDDEVHACLVKAWERTT